MKKYILTKMQKFYRVEYFIIGVLIGMLLMIFAQQMYLHYDTISNLKYKPKLIPNSTLEISKSCNGLDVIQTSNCIKTNIDTFYKYRAWNNAFTLTLDELKKHGGDCVDWSYLIHEIVSPLKIKSMDKSYTGIANVIAGHQFTYIYHPEYEDICRLEVGLYELELECWGIENGNML